MNLAKYDLNLLVTLDALLDERNVTRAGRRLGLSQPAVSSALARLREMFGDELLVRVGRGFELTSLGRDLVDPVRLAIREVEGVLSTRSDFDPGRECRMFRIVARDYVTFLLLQPLVVLLAEQAPGVKVCFSHFDSESLELLGRDEVDLVIMPPDYQRAMLPARTQTPFPSEHLMSDRWMCALWSQHPCRSRTLSVEEYLALRHLIFVPGPRHRIRPRVPVSPINQQRRVAATAESFVLMPFMLKGTDMVCLTPEKLGRQVRKAADIRLLEAPHGFPDLAQSMVWNPRRSRDPALCWMREQVHAVAKSIGGANACHNGDK